jgi:integrase
VVWCAIIVSIATGVRQSEAMRLQWDDVDLDKKTAVIHLSKNDEPRTVHLPPAAITALKRLPLSGVKYVFVNDDGKPMTTKRLWKRWDIVRNAAGLRNKTDKAKNFTWHDLRHCCASYLAQGGASLPQIGSVLGHMSVQSTARYAHLVQGAPVTGHDNIDHKLRRVSR